MRENRICPCCNKKVSLKRCTHYFLYDATHTIRCNHCDNEIKPEKNPTNTSYCIYYGFASIYAPMYIFLYFYDKDFLTSFIYSLPIFIFLITAIMVITIKRLYFVRV